MTGSSFISIRHGHQRLIKKVLHFIHHHVLCPQVDPQGGFIKPIPKGKQEGLGFPGIFGTIIRSTPTDFCRHFIFIQLYLYLNGIFGHLIEFFGKTASDSRAPGHALSDRAYERNAPVAQACPLQEVRDEV